MKTLFIDTHLYNIDIILFNEDTIYKRKTIANEKYNSKFLMPTIKEVLDGEVFDEILVVNGPGSFTGVRLGVTIAKTLAYTLNKKIKTISSLDLIAYSLEKDNCIVSLSDGNGYFVGKYNNYLHEDYFYLKNADYLEYCKLNEIISNCDYDFKLIFNHVKELDYVNPHLVNPIYVKLIGVENDKKN